jgi:hypothetical protein
MKHSNYLKNKICIIVSLSVCFLFAHRLEAAPTNEFLNRLQGTWQGDGKAFGKPARLHMKWEWVLERKFIHLSLKTENELLPGRK